MFQGVSLISKPSNQPLNVTTPFYPPLEDYTKYLQQVWDSGVLTNQGPILQALQSRLTEHLGVPSVCCMGNAGWALQIAFQAMGLSGEVITTPFTYAATTSCLLWEGLQPVFTDIDAETLCLDPTKVEAAITPQTSAILATHVYGIPCDIESLQSIADKHDLKLIFDAAHAFGVSYKGQSLCGYGDASVVSFHATKLFHTGEGGAVISSDQDLMTKVEWMLRYGHRGLESFHGVGINAKMSELHAAMGMAVLDHFDQISMRRQQAHDRYRSTLSALGDRIQMPRYSADANLNYAYFPVLFPSEHQVLECMSRMSDDNIHPRRYFHPLLHKVYLDRPPQLPVAEDLACRILCLPLSAETSAEDIARVCEHIEYVV